MSTGKNNLSPKHRDGIKPLGPLVSKQWVHFMRETVWGPRSLIIIASQQSSSASNADSSTEDCQNTPLLLLKAS